jgi:hypothetical protein
VHGRDPCERPVGEENVMKAVVLALVITWATLLPQTAAMAQTAPAQRREVNVIYVPPKNPSHQLIYGQLKEIGFLGKVREFLSPVQLPRTLLVKLEGCDGDANASYEKDTIVICYEYIDELWKTLPEEMTEDGVTQVDALAGPLLDTILHEVAHAMFDMLSVPV